MQRLEILELEQRLVRRGTARRIARRTVEELYDHFEDLVDYHRRAGRSEQVAERLAAADLGESDMLAAVYREQQSLKGFLARQEWLLSGFQPMLAVGQSVDVKLAGAASRWVAGLVIASLVTASMMLMLQVSISVA